MTTNGTAGAGTTAKFAGPDGMLFERYSNGGVRCRLPNGTEWSGLYITGKDFAAAAAWLTALVAVAAESGAQAMTPEAQLSMIGELCDSVGIEREWPVDPVAPGKPRGLTTLGRVLWLRDRYAAMRNAEDAAYARGVAAGRDADLCIPVVPEKVMYALTRAVECTCLTGCYDCKANLREALMEAKAVEGKCQGCGGSGKGPVPGDKAENDEDPPCSTCAGTGYSDKKLRDAAPAAAPGLATPDEERAILDLLKAYGEARADRAQPPAAATATGGLFHATSTPGYVEKGWWVGPFETEAVARGYARRPAAAGGAAAVPASVADMKEAESRVDVRRYRGWLHPENRSLEDDLLNAVSYLRDENRRLVAAVDDARAQGVRAGEISERANILATIAAREPGARP